MRAGAQRAPARSQECGQGCPRSQEGGQEKVEKKMRYDEDKHILLRDQAHKAKLTPEEYPAFEAALITEGIAVMTVECPAWPPVEKSKLMLVMGGDDPWEGEFWAGNQPAIEASDYLARREAAKTARAMAGPRLAPKRLAYQWQAPEYDPAKHILMRQWLADNEVSIVDFLRKHAPQAAEELGRGVLIDVANPHAEAEAAAGSYSPTRRALAVEDLPILERYADTSKKFSYEAEQPVSWVRSLDDTRWEARRQHEPQRACWQNHRSWVNRTIGDGAWTEADRGPEGHAFGPFMELWDDGAVYLWCYKRALDFLSENELSINGVNVFFSPEKVGPGSVCRMAGHAAAEDMEAILAGAAGEASAAAAAPGAVSDVDCTFVESSTNKAFWKASPGSYLPGAFHRATGSPLVVKKLADGAEVRCWGDASLRNGFVLNGIALSGFEPWKSGFRMRAAQAADAILGLERAPIEDDETPVAAFPAPQPPAAPTDIAEGAKAYSPRAVAAALQKALRTGVSLFGRSASDSAVVALTREGLERFLLDDLSDRDRYVADTGGRNYDCENFAERLRVNLAAKHGVNGCMVVWGDGHAFNAFAVVSEAAEGTSEAAEGKREAAEGTRDDGPEIVLVEPQTDEVVTELTGMYSVERRAEVLL